MCHEDGCGACIVTAKIKGEIMAVNSCLVPILICDGWDIYTIEGLGNRRDGYHSIQITLAEKNGSQCGYCSPGMVMNLYSLVKNKKLTMRQIENSFGGNICRCTGYRPILEAFKKFASDAPPSVTKNICDIEELYEIKACVKKGETYSGSCVDSQLFNKNTTLNIKLGDEEFYKIYSVHDLFEIFRRKPHATYILNGGNTAHGIYRTSKKDLYIDINDVPDLCHIQKTDENLTLGGNVSLRVMMETFQKYSSDAKFKYLRHLAEHIDLVAHVPVRNIGTIAGNLMIKHEHNEFPSDIFLILETVGTQIYILDAPDRKHNMWLSEFFKADMNHKLIYSVVLPPLSDEYEYRSYKIMPRAQNAHGHVNAGFLFKLDGRGRIALEILHDELHPDFVLPDYSPEFRKTLAEGLFYKFVLSIKPEDMNPRFRSGGSLLKRSLSSGTQNYDTDKTVWPVNKSYTKAEYCNDLPPYPREVFCAFVLTEISNGKISNIDVSKALAMKGVTAFYDAKDIPGKNLCISAAHNFYSLMEDELLFAEGDVLYAGQPVGVIVAETHNLANEAAKLVKINYSESLSRKPVISIEDAFASGDNTRFRNSVNVPAKERGENVKREIKGVFECGGQYHYTMETQSCVCVPKEDGMDVYSSTQWMDLNQAAIADVLDVRYNSINVYVRRIGGGYGGKAIRNVQVSCACALACYKLNRPARFVMTIESNMQFQGKRNPTRQKYKVGVDDNGVIQYLNLKHWSNNGCNYNNPYVTETFKFLSKGCYAIDRWTFNGYDVRTDIPSNTVCRGLSSMEAVGMMEHIMEHIARVTKKDPDTVMIKDLSKSADYEMRKRAVEIFNSENRWKKKGIALVTMTFTMEYYGQFSALVSIFARDGTVCVTHGGIECGQGIHTKIAQVTAHTLGIDVELVNVKISNTIVTPNNFVTASSFTSESCAYATIQACNKILKRLEPIRKEMNNPSWKELVFTAYGTMQDDTLKNYNIYGVTIAEVEIDVLTGQHIIRRVDLMEDAGISLNPEIDVGQVEGAFVMGVGCWTSEDLIYDPKTGVLKSDRTWNYTPPGAKDIPEDFRVSLRKNSVNTFGVLRSKATGEPPLDMSCVIPIAIRNALNSARAETGNTDEWYRLDGPYTTERILLNNLTCKEFMTL
ncbi:hypothetical protein P5V15_003899 [Pogonomyrmex californicus]